VAPYPFDKFAIAPKPGNARFVPMGTDIINIEAKNYFSTFFLPKLKIWV
jgi:hypothetical protein